MNTTADENIVGAPKMRNNYGAFQLFFFLLLLEKLSLLIFFASFLVYFLIFISFSIVNALPTIAIAIFADLKGDSDRFFFSLSPLRSKKSDNYTESTTEKKSRIIVQNQ